MNNNIQCSIESSTTKIEFNSAVDGVFLVPELEGLAGLPEIRTTSGVNAGYDGGWTSAQNYDARLISIRGVIANPDVAQVEAKRRAIASLLGQGRKEQLTLRFTTEAGNSYVIYVRTISCEMALQRVLTTQEFLIQLRADDPLIYDDGASGGTEAILQVQKALGGFEINFELPLAIGGGAEDTIVENGAETAYPLINLYGPLHSPTVVNRTTNQQMQILADLQYTISWSGYTTESGSFITLNDAIQNAPMSLTQIKGNAEQNGTPTPDAPVPIDVVTGEQTVGVTGKNQQPTTWGQDFVDAINDASKASVQTYDGRNCLKYAVSAGYGSYPAKNFTLGIRFQPNTQYTFSFDMLKTNAQARTFAIWYSDGTTTTINAGDAGADEWHHYELTSTAGKTVVYATPFYTAGDAYIDIDTFQIEIGTSASQFVSYYGQKFEINLGKNLTDLSTFTIGYVNAVNGTIITQHGNGEMASPFIKVNPNTTYTFKIFETTGTATNWYGVGEYTSADTSGYVRRDTSGETTATSYTFTTSATTNYIRVSARNLEQATKVQLEIGSTSSSYAPYFTPIELAKIGTYQDRIYFDSGKWYIEKQTQTLQMANNSDWGGGILCTNYPSLAYFYSRQFDAVLPTITAVDSASTSTFAKPSTAFYNASPATFFDGSAIFAWDVNTAGVNRLRIAVPATFVTGSTDAQRLTSWKSQLDANDFYIIAPLATPTTTEITDSTLIEQLEHIYQLYGGLNNISIVGAGNGSIEIRYATDKIETRDVVTIDSQARTITLNGQDIYHLKSEESEFLLLAPGDNKLYLTSEVSDDSGYAEVKFKQGYLSI